MGRKPRTNVEIIDEADEFLDSLSNQVELNLTRFEMAIKTIFPEGEGAQNSIDKIVKLINAEETNKRAIGIDENEVTHISESKIADIFEILIADKELAVEIEVDDSNYCNVALEAARNFKELTKDTYLTFRKDENFLLATLVSTNLSKKFREIVDGNEAVVLMSGTLHSETVLKNIFGVENFVTVDAETLSQGAIEIIRTGKEFDCRYSNFNSGRHSREEYLRALETVIERTEKPALVHVNAFSDLPTMEEIDALNLVCLMSKEELLELQRNDKTGKLVSEFKEGKKDILFTTKCSRGIDFPGDTCKSVVFTKYPNPNVKNTFWRILEKTHREFYWDFYKDKARREFLQRIYRALRSKEDRVSVLSPDLRVLEAVRELQENGH